MAVMMFFSVSERERRGARMAAEEDLSLLKRKIVAVDKLVRSKQKVERRNDEICHTLEEKQKELEEAKKAREEALEKSRDLALAKTKEVAELKAKLADAESGSNRFRVDFKCSTICSGSQDLLLPTQPVAPGSRDEVRKVMLELEEVREKLQEATKKERQLLKNHEQVGRYAFHLTVLKIIKNVVFPILCWLSDSRSLEQVKMESAKRAARVF